MLSDEQIPCKYFCGLLNEAFAIQRRMVRRKEIGKDLEGGSYGIIEVLSRPGRTEEKYEQQQSR
jgi:hypothetical protein